MCMESERWVDRVEIFEVSVRCDQSTYDVCKNYFDFETPSRDVVLKGLSGPLSFYPLVGARRNGAGTVADTLQSKLFGRESEVSIIDGTIERWRQDRPHQKLLSLEARVRRYTVHLSGLVLVPWRASSCISSAASICRSKIRCFGLTKLIVSGRTDEPTLAARQAFQRCRSDIVVLVRFCVLLERGALHALKAIPGFRWADAMSVQSGDTALTLSSVVTQLLLAVQRLQFKIVVICDDGQSWRVLHGKMQLCPLVLFVVAGRAVEEWELREELDNLLLHCTHHIQLGPLSVESIKSIIQHSLGEVAADDNIIQSIIQRSNGIPIALHVILSNIKAHCSLDSSRTVCVGS
ncbi:hypothetical protein DFJ73DRAFT_19709 [Zopfochytrium polystomum]|nr:hypothetical protein DFJ73DRAFT_19709 [Zopfochytrium polystomum]